MNMPAAPLIGQPVDRAEDRRFLTGAGTFVDDLKRRRHAARGGLAQQRRAWTHQRRRCAGCAGTARAFERSSPRPRSGRYPGHPVAARQSSEFTPYLQPVIAKRQGALCRRAARRRGRGQPGARRRRAGGDRSRHRDRCRRCADRHAARRATRRCCSSRTAATSRSATWSTFGDADAAFAKAEYTRRESFRCHRLTALPLETRGCIAEWDAADKSRLTVFGATKVLFFNRRMLAPMLGLPSTPST